MGYLLRMGKLWLIVIFVVAAGLIGYNNPEVISIHFPYLRALNLPIYQVIFASFIMGMSLAMLYLAKDNLQKILIIRSQRRELEELRGKVQSPGPKTDDAPLVSQIEPSKDMEQLPSAEDVVK